MEKPQNNSELMIAAGILLGIGLAGLFDGVVLHKILKWHHMLSSVKPLTNTYNLELNTLWDEFFLWGIYIIIAVGLVLIWRASQVGDILSSPKIFGACLAIGAGSFNLIEGLIDHHILGIHHVKSGANELAWDLGFLAISAVLVVVGWTLLRSQVRVKSE